MQKRLAISGLLFRFLTFSYEKSRQWVVVNGGAYILAGGGQLWIYFDWWWMVMNGGGYGGCILAGGGWRWMVVGGGGCWWVVAQFSLTQQQLILHFVIFCSFMFSEHCFKRYLFFSWLMVSILEIVWRFQILLQKQGVFYLYLGIVDKIRFHYGTDLGKLTNFCSL